MPPLRCGKCGKSRFATYVVVAAALPLQTSRGGKRSSGLATLVVRQRRNDEDEWQLMPGAPMRLVSTLRLSELADGRPSLEISMRSSTIRLPVALSSFRRCINGSGPERVGDYRHFFAVVLVVALVIFGIVLLSRRILGKRD